MEVPSLRTLILSLVVVGGVFTAIIGFLTIVNQAYSTNITSDPTLGLMINQTSGAITNMKNTVGNFSVASTSSAFDYLIGAIVWGYNFVTGVTGLVTGTMGAFTVAMLVPLGFLGLEGVSWLIGAVISVILIFVVVYVLLKIVP